MNGLVAGGFDADGNGEVDLCVDIACPAPTPAPPTLPPTDVPTPSPTQSKDATVVLDVGLTEWVTGAEQAMMCDAFLPVVAVKLGVPETRISCMSEAAEAPHYYTFRLNINLPFDTIITAENAAAVAQDLVALDELAGAQVTLVSFQDGVLATPITINERVTRTPTPYPTLAIIGSHDLSKCSDNNEECCASAEWGEPQTCKDGYVVIPSAAKDCPSSDYGCPYYLDGIGCYGCYAPGTSIPDYTGVVRGNDYCMPDSRGVCRELDYPEPGVNTDEDCTGIRSNTFCAEGYKYSSKEQVGTIYKYCDLYKTCCTPCLEDDYLSGSCDNKSPWYKDHEGTGTDQECVDGKYFVDLFSGFFFIAVAIASCSVGVCWKTGVFCFKKRGDMRNSPPVLNVNGAAAPPIVNGASMPQQPGMVVQMTKMFQRPAGYSGVPDISDEYDTPTITTTSTAARTASQGPSVTVVQGIIVDPKLNVHGNSGGAQREWVFPTSQSGLAVL
jgi:hypothetical protein